MPNYLAITIGPIYKTLSLARKTRELWSASFTFSRLMKHLIEAFSKHGRLISPGMNIAQPLHGAGVFPDRCFIKLKGNFLDEEQVEKLKDEAFTNFHKETGLWNTEDYYQVYIVQCSIDDHPVGYLNEMLDVLELQQKYSSKPAVDWGKQWEDGSYFQNLYKVAFAKDDALLPELFLKSNYSIRRFPSIPEISTNEFAKRDVDKYWSAIGYQGIKRGNDEKPFQRVNQSELPNEVDDDDLILAKIKKAFPDEFLMRHKYFSVVAADGDNIGSLIREVETKGGDLRQLSQLLNSFTAKAAGLLVDYGAFPVYMGGDDLLFFAPMATAFAGERFLFTSLAHGDISGNNLFFLLSSLNQVFQSELQPIVQTHSIRVSLSFGVRCGYYKQPLREIMEGAHNNLFENAKNQPGKNYIALEVEKHSGQSFHPGFTQEGTLYESFLRLSAQTDNKGMPFLNSLMYKLNDQRAILENIGSDAERLTLFFAENFNESGHPVYKDFFAAASGLIHAVFTQMSHLSLDGKLEKIYGALRFVHFINAKDAND